MAVAQQNALLGPPSESSRTLLRVVILLFIAGAAIASRLFSVIRKGYSYRKHSCHQCANQFNPAGFESIIHECQLPSLSSVESIAPY